MCECKVCGVEKVRTKVGTYKAGGSIFVDERDRAWNGRTCPPCQHAQVASRRAQSPRRHYRKRLKEESQKLDPREYGPAEPMYAAKLRPCRTCSTMSPNYYECDPCRLPKLDESGCFEEVVIALPFSSKNFKAGFQY